MTTVADNCTISVNVEGKWQDSRFSGFAQYHKHRLSGRSAKWCQRFSRAFKAQGGVGAGIKDFPFELSYDVQSFTFTCDTDDGDIVSVPNSGANFSTAVRMHECPGKRNKM